MTSVNLGPFAFPIGPLLLLGALLVSSGIAKWVCRNRSIDVEPALWKILVSGVLVARIAFVALYFESYKNSPWKIVDIRDGGFIASAGFLAAAALTAWFARQRREARKPLLLSALAGATFWMAGTLATSIFHAAPMPLPEIALARLDGTSMRLDSLTGKPLVVNLWATWCPPCRREMPVLRDAQVRHKDIDFVFVNQGESADAVRKYLALEGLALDNVLLDPRLQVGAQTGSRALPTTLFFNAQGMLVDRRMGELSSATLMQRIEALRRE